MCPRQRSEVTGAEYRYPALSIPLPTQCHDRLQGMHQDGLDFSTGEKPLYFKDVLLPKTNSRNRC